jgi:hypothetical protein
LCSTSLKVWQGHWDAENCGPALVAATTTDRQEELVGFWVFDRSCAVQTLTPEVLVMIFCVSFLFRWIWPQEMASEPVQVLHPPQLQSPWGWVSFSLVFRQQLLLPSLLVALILAQMAPGCDFSVAGLAILTTGSAICPAEGSPLEAQLTQSFFSGADWVLEVPWGCRLLSSRSLHAPWNTHLDCAESGF